VTAEKNVRFLVELERALLAAGRSEFLFCVVGDGRERQWLERTLTKGVFTGILRGEALANAYANLDLFVFPSKTDTFGNVILEAAASGVPAVVSNQGGPKNLVLPGLTGCIARDDADFVAMVLALAGDREWLKRMGAAARENTLHTSWDGACEMIYAAYEHAIALKQGMVATRTKKMSSGQHVFRHIL